MSCIKDIAVIKNDEVGLTNVFDTEVRVHIILMNIRTIDIILFLEFFVANRFYRITKEIVRFRKYILIILSMKRVQYHCDLEN